MKAEISIQCDIITDYDEAVKREKQGKIVWTIFIDKDNQHYQEKLVKKKGVVGWAIMDKAAPEIQMEEKRRW